MPLIQPEIKDALSAYSIDTDPIITVPISPTATDGDLLILTYAYRDNNVPATPAGWLSLGNVNNPSSKNSLGAFGKLWAAGDGSNLVFDSGTADCKAVTIHVVRTQTFDPLAYSEGFAGTPNLASTNAPLIPSTIATEASSTRLAWGLMNQSATTGAGMTKPATFDAQHATGYATNGARGMRYCSASDAVPAGATGTATFVSPGTNTAGTANLILRPYDSTVAPPVAAFTYAPHTGDRPLLVTFTYESTGQVTDGLWEFGDGDTATIANPQHTFLTVGTFNVKLTVNGPGGSSFVIHPVVVTASTGPKESAFEEPSQLQFIVNGVYLDPFRVVLPITQLFGRSDPGVQPEAPAFTFSWLGPLTFNYGTEPVSLTIGASLAVEYDQGQGGPWQDIWVDDWSPPLPNDVEPVPRTPIFTGRITDLTASSDPLTLITSLTAVGNTAEAAVFPVGYSSAPQETEAERVNRVNVAVPFDIVNDANNEWIILARDPLVVNAIDGLQQLAESTGAVVWEDGSGRIHYQGSLDRIDVGAAPLPLSRFEILSPVGWSQTVGNLWNQVEIVYGPEVASPGLRARVRVSNPDTVGNLGTRTLKLETRLANEDDATVYAELVLRHWSDPFWDANQIVVRMELLDPAAWAALVQRGINDLLLLDGITPSPSTPAGEGTWIIEGVVMTYSRDSTGRLIHERQYALSDLTRWGNQPLETVTTAVAVPTAGPLGTSFVVTATVKDSTGAVVSPGSVQVWDGTRLLGTGTLTVAGVATIPAVPVATGTRTLVARFTGTPLFAASEATLRVDVSAVTTATVTMTALPSTVNGGATVTLKATMNPTAAPGTIEWSYNRGTGWLVWTGNDSALVNGIATASWVTSSSSFPSYQWRARYIPTPGAAFNGATSPAVTVTVKQKTTRTLTYSATDSGSYQSDGDIRSGVDDCYQGYYSGTNGNQKSLALMPAAMNTDWTGWTLTKVEIQVTTPHWNSAAGGTLILGSSSSSSIPSTWPGATSDRQRQAMKRGETRWIDVTTWGSTFAGSSRCVAFGPGPSTSSTYYGYATGTGTDRPKVRITGYRYE